MGCRLVVLCASLGQESAHSHIRGINLPGELARGIWMVRIGAVVNSNFNLVRADSASGVQVKGRVVDVSCVRGAATWL